MLDTEQNPNSAPKPDGIVRAVRGAVVDVTFAGAELPPINSALVVEWDRPGPLILEVHSHLDLNTLRAVAFQPTEGLARGVQVRATGGPITVPVGKAVLGRLLDVVGVPHDNGPDLPPDTPRRPIHALPPLLRSQTRTTDVFETGIKVIDLLTPMAQGGKAAMFGGAGVGKTVVLRNDRLLCDTGAALRHLTHAGERRGTDRKNGGLSDRSEVGSPLPFA